MSCELIWISLTAIASWALVFVTWFVVTKQIKKAKEDMQEQINVSREGLREQLQMGRNDLKVRLQISYEDKFDSQSLISERKKLAEQLFTNTPHSDIQETVMNFFESVGMLLRKEYFDLDMAWSAFSFYAIRWWSATKDYIFEERRLEHDDDTIFKDFEEFVDAMYKYETEKRHLSRASLEPSKQDVERFLESEKNL
jgi:hypothetical protein